MAVVITKLFGNKNTYVASCVSGIPPGQVDVSAATAHNLNNITSQAVANTLIARNATYSTVVAYGATPIALVIGTTTVTVYQEGGSTCIIKLQKIHSFPR